MDHFFLQTWLAGWQTGALAGGAANSFGKNALGDFWRDVGNLITATGVGWAATRDAFFNLVGADLPAQQPQTGGDAVRDTVGSWMRQILDGLLTGDEAGTAPSTQSGSATTRSGSTQPSLADLLPSDMGGKTTLADVVDAAKGAPSED